MKTKTILFALSFLTIAAFAQKEKSDYDLNGKFSGKRFQYTADQQGILQTFQYEFDLVQNGNTVTGVSTIISENGDYGDLLLKGIIVGDKLHFSEYQVKGEARPEGKVWCFKSGELSIKADDKGTHLVGSTPSFIPEYFYPCTGGYTDILNPEQKAQNEKRSLTANVNSTFEMSVFPNPFLDKTAITYSLSENETVSLEVLDLNGKLIAVVEKPTNKEKGKYTVPFQKSGLAAGVLIAKLTVGKNVYSKQIVVIN